MIQLRALAAAAVLAARLWPASAQDATLPPTFRVSVDRIQIGAVVTDAKGVPVTDLGIGDFTILDGGKRQQLTSCEYIRSVATGAAGTAAAPDGRGLTAMPGAGARPLAREQTGRSIVLLVDDLSFQPTTIPAVREALAGAIERYLQPTDTAALIRTSSGNSSLEQFTSNKRVLLESAARISWRPGANIDRALRVIQYVISALRDLPGRKAIFLISQGFPIGGGYNNPRTGLAQILGVLVDRALRAGVVIYCIDPTPLAPLAVDASYDETGEILRVQAGRPGPMPRTTSPDVAAQVQQQVQGYTLAQLARLEFYRTGLRLLSEGTGGQMAADTDIANALGRFTGDLEGYYLLTYRPTSAERYFGAKRGGVPFRGVKVRVAQAGLRVRSYAGYMPLKDSDEPDPSAATGIGNEVGKALFSPFPASGIHVDLISTFTAADTVSPALSLMVHIDAHDVSFSAEDGRHDAHLDLVARAGGEWDQPGEMVSKEIVLHLKEESFAEAMAIGLQYPVSITPPRSGLYDIRVAVRDRTSGKLGSARNFVKAPDLLSGRPALTGPELSEGGRQTSQFRAADRIHFECRVFNSNAANAEVRVVRDGQLVLALPAAVDAGGIKGSIPLTSLTAGRYALQVVAETAASQWAEFEIVPF